MGEGTTVLGLVGDTSALDTDSILRNPCIERIMKVQEPYKLANRKMHPEDTIVTIGGKVQVGGKKLVVMAGPCSVESKGADPGDRPGGQGRRRHRAARRRVETPLLPYAFQGYKEKALEYLVAAREETGLPIVTEITNPAHVEKFIGKCDCFQVGARNMQNFELLKELGQTDIPVLLKRGLAQHH